MTRGEVETSHKAKDRWITNETGPIICYQWKQHKFDPTQEGANDMAKIVDFKLQNSISLGQCHFSCISL